MKRLRAAALIACGSVLVVMVLAAILQPFLPWLFAVFMLGCIFKIAVRD